MKRMILLTVLLAAISTAALARKVVAKGETFSPLGKYRIETVDEAVPLKGNDCQAYRISYENSPMEVTVIICKEKDCKKYVVLSDKLSVQYVCNPVYLGVERLDKLMEKEGYKTTDEFLNREEYFHQKVLGPGGQPEIENTSLIAAYFPFLLKTEATMTATR